MKKVIAILVLMFAISACSLNDDNSNGFSVALLPVETVQIPESFQYGNTYLIKMTYKRPTTCHSYSGIYFTSKDTVRTVAIQNLVENRSDCQAIEIGVPQEASFNFKVLEIEGKSYKFRFYKGIGENGQDLFEEIIVPVVAPTNVIGSSN